MYPSEGAILGAKEEMLVTHFFSLCPQCFQKFLFSGSLVLWNVWLWLNELFPKRQNFELVEIETICRRQNKCDGKLEISFGLGRKHCGKRRKCWLPAFSLFPTMFSKGFFKVIKSWDCVVKN